MRPVPSYACAKVYDCDDYASSRPVSLIHLIVRGICFVVFCGAYLLGRDIHRDGTDYSGLGYCLTAVLYQNFAHSLSAGQGTIYIARHLVFKSDGVDFVLGHDDVDVPWGDRLDDCSRSHLNMPRQWVP